MFREEKVVSFGRLNNLQNKLLPADKQTAVRANMYNTNSSAVSRVARADRLSSHIDDRSDRRLRVKDLRDLFDSGNSEQKAVNLKKRDFGGVGNVQSTISNTDHLASRDTFATDKETVKTNTAIGYERSKHGDIDSNASYVVDHGSITNSTGFVNRTRVYTAPVQSTNSNGDAISDREQSLQGIKLSREEAKHAWRLSLRAVPKESSIEDDSSNDSSSENNLDDSHHQISDEKVIEMLQKYHATEELKKMFDGPEAFNATTKRQSINAANDTRDNYTKTVENGPSLMSTAEYDEKTQSSEEGSVKDEKEQDGISQENATNESIINHHLAPEDAMNVSHFLASPTTPRRNVTSNGTETTTEDSQVNVSSHQADNYLSLYNNFLKQEGVTSEENTPQQKMTPRYTRETFRPPMYSTDSDGDLNSEKQTDHEEMKTKVSNEKLLPRDNSIDDLMPKDYDDETQDDQAPESSYDDSDVGSMTTPEHQSDFQFNYPVNHSNDLDSETEAKISPKKRGVRFSDSPHTVFEVDHPLDYDRGNDDIDPVSSSAEWELEKRVEKMDIFSVDLDKGGKLFVFSLTKM